MIESRLSWKRSINQLVRKLVRFLNMKVAIDSRILKEKKYHGIHLYTKGLLDNLPHYKDVNDELVPLFDYPKLALISGRLGRIATDRFLVPAILTFHRFDILHLTSFNDCDWDLRSLVPKSYRVIVTIHDLTPLIFPDMLLDPLPKETRASYLSQLGMAQKADHFIAISESTKKDLVKFWGIHEEKISRVYQCLYTDIFEPINDLDLKNKVREKYNLPDNFILSVSGPSPHKNISGLIKAFSLLSRDLRNRFPLVVVARLSREDLKMKEEETIGLEVKDSVKFIAIEDSEKPVIYNLAKVMVFTSLYEGFGLTPLEAMSCGTPVVASKVSSIPEIVGEAGLLVDPLNFEEIAEAINKVINDPDLARDLREKGIEQAKKFSIERWSKETLAVYHKVSSK